MSDRVSLPCMNIGITLGDPGGIGAELIIKVFAEPWFRERFTPVLLGSTKVLNVTRKQIESEKFAFTPVQDLSAIRPGRLNVLDCMPLPERFEIGKATPEGGKAALAALDTGIAALKNGQIQALVTLPLDKSTVALHAPGFKGHTEYLAAAFGVKDNLMLLMDDRLRVGLVTNHLPIKDVAQAITTQGILRKIKMLHATLQRDFAVDKPIIGVMGLNPHAGDDGLIGKEEKEIILPALQQAVNEGIIVQGPFPADGLFASGNFRKFDALLAMYHDQGLIPFKYISGYGGVNYTAGMPVVRTSPDHGTAYDIAGQGIADPASLRYALYAALDISRTRAEYEGLKENVLKPRPYKGGREN